MKMKLPLYAKFVTLLTAFLVLLVPSALAQGSGSTPEEEAKDFGFYNEFNLDLEVKVQGGFIRIYRSWRGDKKEWTINPQHGELSFSEETDGELYGQLLAKEIGRGPRAFTKISGLTGVWGKATSASAESSAPGGAVPPGVSGILVAHGIDYCTNEGEGVTELVSAQPDGYRWVDRIGRKWADFSESGALNAWGKGNYLIGQVVYDQEENVSGYADTTLTQVITYTRYPSGKIHTISDDQGATVTYTYYGNGQLESVTDADGYKTTYTYNADGQIATKIMGDDSAALPGEEIGEETTLTYDYFPNGELKSVLTGDQTRSDYTYEYNEELEQYKTTETMTGNRIKVTVSNNEDGLVEIRKNGSIDLRVVRLCEDSAIIDRHNRVTYIDRDAIGIIRTVYFPDGRKLSFEHSNANWPELGNPWDQPTAPWGLIKVTYPSGTEVSYERNPDGTIATATEVTPGGEVRYWSFQYDSYGNRTEQRLQASETPDNAKDRIEKWHYDAHGNIDYYEDVLARRFTYEYNRRGDITKIIGPDLKEWVFTYTRKGQLKTFEDPRGYRQEFRYTKRGLLRKFIERHTSGAPDAETIFRYNHRGLVKKIIDPFLYEWNYEYNQSGEVERIIDPLNKDSEYQYDYLGRVKQVKDGNDVAVDINYFDTSLPGQAPQTSIAFSPLVQIEYPTYKEELIYDKVQRLTSRAIRPNTSGIIESELTQYRYDQDGRLDRITRPDNNHIYYTWDQMGRVKSIQRPGRGTFSLAYPEAEKFIEYNDPVGGQIKQEFNQLGEMIKETRADLTEVNFTYNAYGNIETYVNARGNKHEYIYNDAQQVEQIKIYADTSATTPLRTITYTRNLRGDITGYDDGSITITFTLDALGRVLSAVTNYGSFSKTHSYTYAENGLPKTYTAVNGVTYTYNWDAANQFAGFSIPGEGIVTVNYNTTDWFQPESVVFPGGSRQNFEYDELRRIKRIHSKNAGGNTLLDYNYTYTKGPVEGAVVDTITTEHGLYDFEYDDAYRLTSAIKPNAPPEAYTYDALDRRSPETGAPWVYNANGALENGGGATYTYDDDGNVDTRTVGGVVTKFFYDESDRLVRAESPVGTVIAEYGYDHFGRRLWKEVSGTRTYFAYTAEGLSAEMDDQGNVTRTYHFAPGSYWTTSPLMMEEAGTYYYFHNDHLGTPQKITDKLGVVVWSARYSAFGEATVDGSSTIENPLRFPGQYFDGETGVHHNYLRNYEPGIGTYLEQDPYGVAFTGPNRYGYAGLNPANYFDPTGEIIPVLVVGAKVLWVAGMAYTGFEAYQCWESLMEDPCAAIFEGDACLNTVLAAAIPYGAGKLARYLKGLAPAARELTKVAKPQLLLPFKPKWTGQIVKYKKGAMPPIEHIFYRHGPNSGFSNVGRFAEGTSARDIKNLVEEAAVSGQWKWANGRASITHNFDKVIGTHKDGSPAKALQVYLNEAGEVMTAFPVY